MEDIDIRPAQVRDMPLLSRALECLSADLGDSHRAKPDDLAAACFGAYPVCHGTIAVDAGDAVGAALVSPVYSTTLGVAGAFVSDLWVAKTMRSRGLGQRLIRHCASLGTTRWQARYLKLTVYARNKTAQVFYETLGFRLAEGDLSFLMTGANFDTFSERQK